MRARRIGPGVLPSEELRSEAFVLVPDRATAARIRAKRPQLRVIVAGDRLPLCDGALEALVDEHAASPAAVEEGARVVRAGGRLTLIAEGRGAGLLGGLWRKARPALSRTDASAWLLGAGCEELVQSEPREGRVVTEGRVRGGLAGPSGRARP